MKKKSSHLKNFKTFLKADQKRSSSHIDIPKKHRIELPKIESSAFQNLLAKKTLIAASQKLEEYLEAWENNVPKIVLECSAWLKEQAKTYATFIKGEVRKTEFNEENKENNSIYRSQIFNVNISKLRKVQSKDLFDKVTAVKYSIGDFMDANEKEVIAALKGKLKEKDETIRKLHIHIDEVQVEISALKQSIQQNTKRNNSQLMQKTNLCQSLKKEVENKEIFQKQIDVLRQQNKSIQANNLQLMRKNLFLNKQAVDKDREIVSIWQAVLRHHTQ